MLKDKPMSVAAAQKRDEDREPQEYEIEDAASTLMRAEKIKNDKRIMPHVHKHLKKKVREIRSIQDIRDAAHEMSEKNKED